jgi:hypothetical protein
MGFKPTWELAAQCYSVETLYYTIRLAEIINYQEKDSKKA